MIQHDKVTLQPPVLKGLTTDDLSKELLRCVSKERDTANQKFIEDDPHRPPVHWLPVTLPEDYLGGDVLRSAAHLHKQTNSLDKLKTLLTVSVAHLACSLKPCAPLKQSYLFVNKLSRVFLHVTLTQIGGHVHQANFRKAKVCELDVAHGCDQ